MPDIFNGRSPAAQDAANFFLGPSQGRRMLDFLDLPFEESVLDFYKTKRLVKTPSASQVRQPIYGDALQAWRKYEQHLGPLIDTLDWEAIGIERPA